MLQYAHIQIQTNCDFRNCVLLLLATKTYLEGFMISIRKYFSLSVIAMLTATVFCMSLIETANAAISIEDAYTADQYVYLSLYNDGKRVEHGTIYFYIAVENPQTGDLIYEKDLRKGYFVKGNSSNSIKLHRYPKKIVGYSGTLSVRVVDASGEEYEATFTLEF